MFEWIKEIIGETYTEEVDKKVAGELGKMFVSRADFNAANEAKKSLEGQIKERDKQLETLNKHSESSEELKTQIKELQTQNKEQTDKHESDLIGLHKVAALQAELAAHVYDPADIISGLDIGTIELDESNKLKVGVEGLLSPLRESKPYLFKPSKQELTQMRGASPANGADPRAMADPMTTEVRSIFGIK